MREVAISSCALVIFLVELTDRIRSRNSRRFAMMFRSSLLNFYSVSVSKARGLLLSRLTGDVDFGLLEFFIRQRINWSFSAQVVSFAGAVGRSEVLSCSQPRFLRLVGNCITAANLLVFLCVVMLLVLLF